MLEVSEVLSLCVRERDYLAILLQWPCYFFLVKKVKWSFPGVYFFKNAQKNPLNSKLILTVVLEFKVCNYKTITTFYLNSGVSIKAVSSGLPIYLLPIGALTPISRSVIHKIFNAPFTWSHARLPIPSSAGTYGKSYWNACAVGQ